MVVLLVLGISTIVFRILGALGVHSFSSWEVSTRFGLAIMFLFTASAHFTSMKDDLIRMVPNFVPNPKLMVVFTGMCEILGAIGLMLPWLHQLAAIALIVFLVAVLPANIHAARNSVTLRGKPATPLALRIPMQVLFIILIWWSAI